MSVDEDGWILLSAEMFDRLEPLVGAEFTDSAKDTTFSGEPFAGALFMLGRIAETGGVVDLDFLDRLAGWFLQDDDDDEPFVAELREVFAILRDRAIKAS